MNGTPNPTDPVEGTGQPDPSQESQAPPQPQATPPWPPQRPVPVPQRDPRFKSPAMACRRWPTVTPRKRAFRRC